jgi:gas vesicle protein
MSHNYSSLSIIAALVAGALVGASAGILFAPSKGSKTRKKISREAKTITKDLMNLAKTEANLMQVKLSGLISAANEIEQEMHQETKSLEI